ncbi:MAG: helix-turn-helix domain-containing protein [Desulfobulbaceae bacterium]|nr:helix-turn-helix domain-containing protein [Desulfobulbaceae bacterium]
MSKKHLEQSDEQNQNDNLETPEDIGHHLRNLRIKQGLEIKEATRETKISTVNIISIEDQEYSALPADTFTRGLVTLYANYLGENGQKMAELFLQARNNFVTESVHHKKNKKPSGLFDPSKYAERTHLPPAIIAAFVLIASIIFLFILYSYTSWNPLRSTLNTPDSNDQMIPPSESIYTPESQDTQHIDTADEHLNNSTNSRTNDNSNSESIVTIETTTDQETTQLSVEKLVDVNTTNALDTNEPTPTQQPTINEIINNNSIKNLEINELPTQTDTYSDTEPAQPTSPKYVLTLSFTKDTWVDISRDNGQLIRHIADKGDYRIIKADKWIELSFNKPNCARIQLNGIDVDFPVANDDDEYYSLSIPEDVLD